MLFLHFKEIQYRFLYFISSNLFTFFIFFINKESLLYLIAPLNLYYNNLLDVLWCYIYLITLLTFIWNTPNLIYNFLFFIKPGMSIKEFFIIKKHVQFFYILFFICFFILYFILLTIILTFSYSFNSELLNMQITFSSYIDILVKLLIFLYLSVLFSVLWLNKRIKNYFLFFILLCLMSPFDIINLSIFFIFYIIYTEINIFLYYIFFNKGFVT